jgi:hypothetical protein
MTNRPLRFGLVVVLLVLSAACLVTAQSRGDRVSYKDPIVVAVGETRENIIAFGSDVVVEGAVKKSVLAVGGSITVSGTVGEAVVGIGSRIKLLPEAEINGDLVMIGGSVTKSR